MHLLMLKVLYAFSKENSNILLRKQSTATLPIGNDYGKLYNIAWTVAGFGSLSMVCCEYPAIYDLLARISQIYNRTVHGPFIFCAPGNR